MFYGIFKSLKKCQILFKQFNKGIVANVMLLNSVENYLNSHEVCKLFSTAQMIAENFYTN